MTNTAEVIRHDNGSYRVTTQSSNEEIAVEGIRIEDSEHIESHTIEDGYNHINAEEGYEFVVERTRVNDSIVGELKVVEEEKGGTFLFPYRDSYTFQEKVNEVGIPDVQDAYDSFKYMPSVKLEIKWDPKHDVRRPTGVEINGTMYTLDKR